MWIAVVGVDHSTAPIELRERLDCAPEQARALLAMAQELTRECVLISTCNRIELYATGSGVFDSERSRDLLRVLGEARNVGMAELEAHAYSFAGKEAVSHLFEVACGLRSSVLGEAQIQGQVAASLEMAHASGFTGPITSALFRAALVAGKRARRETGISRSAASVSHVAVQVARRLFPRLKEASVLLIGSGEMSELAARNLRDNGAKRLVILNRTLERAVDLARRYDAAVRPFDELDMALSEADIAIASTHAPYALITADLVRQVMQRRGGRPLLLIDIALPRDVEPGVGALPGVYLYNLDDLRAGVSQGLQQREQEVAHVQQVIHEQMGLFESWLRSRGVAGMIGDMRQRAEMLRQQELARTLRQLSPALTEQDIEAIKMLSASLTNKLLHTPTMRLKEAASTNDESALLEAFGYFFDVEVQHDETTYDWDARQQAGPVADADDCRASEETVARRADYARTHPYQG
jgi:glutamyl-tRNA reductase